MMDDLREFYKLKTAEYFTSSRQDIIPFIPEGTNTLLDVGCGVGNFAKAFKDLAGAKVHGLEMDSSAAKKASAVLDKVFVGDINSLMDTLEDNFYDCITFNDVLEHIFDPYKLIYNLRSKLTSNGVIVASIPNVRYFRNLTNLLFKKDWQYAEAGILDFTHLRFFTQKSIIRMFEENGYSVVQCKGITRTKSLKPYIYLLLTLGAFGKDTTYMHFAIVAKKYDA